MKVVLCEYIVYKYLYDNFFGGYVPKFRILLHVVLLQLDLSYF